MKESIELLLKFEYEKIAGFKLGLDEAFYINDINKIQHYSKMIYETTVMIKKLNGYMY